MPIPLTKVLLSSALSGGRAIRFLPNASGDFSLTVTGSPVPSWISAISDLNADGRPDFIFGAPGDDDKAVNAGRVFVRLGAVANGATVNVQDSLNSIIIDGIAAGDRTGAAVGSIADLNADGRSEILIGAPGKDVGALADAGTAFVVWGGAVPGGVDLNDPFTASGKGFAIKGQAAGDAAGTTLTSIADLNGDGKAEILVGAPGNDAGGADAGAVYVVFGKSTGSIVSLSNVAAGTGGYKIIGDGSGDQAGLVLGTIGDLNGDGKAEILIGTPDSQAGGTNSGAVYVAFGKSTGTALDLTNVAAGTGGFRIKGEAQSDAGAAVAGIGDVNGDGLQDILVGAPRSDSAYVVFGKADGAEVDLANVAAGIGGFKIVGEVAGDLDSLSVAGGADLNRDGIADFVIGASGNEEGGANSGAVYVVWGGGSGTVDLSLVAQGIGGAKIVGPAGSLTGSSVAITGDVNGDGAADLMIGAPGTGESVYTLFAAASWQPDLNIYGTAGNDLIGAGYGGAHVVGETDDAILGLGGNDTISGAGGNDTIEGGAGNDTLNGGAGNDSLDGGAGNDSMAGGAGNDTYVVNAALDVVSEVAGEGIDTVRSSVSFTLADQVENLVLTAAGLTGIGNGLGNAITGTSGSDTLDGAGGADTMTGGLGNDTYRIDNAGDIVSEAAGAGTGVDTVVSAIDYVLGANLENLVLSGAARSGTGNALSNSLTGTAFNDTLDGGALADTMAGGLGDDTYFADNAGDSVVEGGSAGTDTVVASVNYALGLNVENLTLTGAARSATGNGLANVITGTAFNDTLDGGALADTMDGGLGDDTYIVDNAGDTIVEAGGGGTDLAVASIDYTLGGTAIENLTLTGSAHTGTGNALANVITGGSGSDTLDGAGGADTLSGGAGDDRYVVDNSGDTIIEAAGGGTDTVASSVSYTLGAETENLELSGAGTSGTGNALANTLTGSAGGQALAGLEGNDTLDGGAGADTMTGGAGDDTYYIDDAGDVVVEDAGGGTDTIVTAFDIASLAANIENVRLTGAAHSVVGNAANNRLSSGSGNDTLDGGDGDDLELGGDGHDTLVSRSGIDTLSGGSGDDRYVVHGGEVHIEDFLGHDTLDASESGEDNHIDLSGETSSEIDHHLCEFGQGGTTAAPLDVQFLQDLSGSFGDDIANVRALVPQIVAALQAVQADSRFGVTSFIDKPVSPFGAAGEWVYQLELALTASSAALSATYNSLVIRNGADEPEAQLEGLMQLALHQIETGFRPDSARFVVLFTDAPFHQAGDGAAGGILIPNNGDNQTPGGGALEDYPLISQLQSALAAANIIPIFAIANGYESVYQSLLTDLGRGAVVSLTADSSNIVAAITAGLTAATTTRIEDAIGGSGNDSITGSSGDNHLWGRAGNDAMAGGLGHDILEGEAGNDTLTGGGGDTLIGGTGNDTYVDPGSADVIVEGAGSANGAADIVMSGASFALTAVANVERLTLTGTADIDGTGNALANVIRGNSGANTLDGAGGNDTLVGGDGADALIGGEGNDVLNGGNGADTMTGGNGDDVYLNPILGGAAADTIVELAGGGVDEVQSNRSISLAFSAFVERLILTGAGNINGSGNNEANYIAGNGGANILNGGSGADTLIGGAGKDILIGGKGNDVMDGGADADTFRFSVAGTNRDTINGFETALDRFDLSGGTFTSATESGGSTTLVHSGGTVLVAGVAGLSLADWNALVLPAGGAASALAAVAETAMAVQDAPAAAPFAAGLEFIPPLWNAPVAMHADFF
jgi:Ca2+-binding RTX toxin-like protein